MSDPSPSSSRSTHPTPKRQPPPLSIQAVVPPIVSVEETPQTDIPFRQCFTWRKSTLRTEWEKREIMTTVCFRKLAPPRPKIPLTALSQFAVVPSSTSFRTLAENKSTAAEDSTPLQAKGKEPEQPPWEIPFLERRLLEIHVFDNTKMPDRLDNVPQGNISLQVYPNGTFKRLEPGKNSTLIDFKETNLGFEHYDTLGGYHFYAPIGLFHHRVYNTVASHLDRTYGPAVRMVTQTSNRVRESYATGKQQEAWDIIWTRLSNAEGAKLWVRMWDRAVGADKTKDDDKKDGSDKPSGKGKSQP